MAFFKFRFPGKRPDTAADGLPAAQGQSIEVLRRRARHRLLGAVVLVFIAVVAFPLLFGSQPRPVAVDTPVVIPDRNNTPLAAVPAGQAPAKPLLSAMPEVPVPTQASLEPGKEEVVTTPSPGASAPTSAVHPAPKTAASVQAPMHEATALPVPMAKTETKAETKVPDKDSAAPATDAHKAKPLVAGQSGGTEAGSRAIVQVGAFTNVDKVREVRRKLEQAGLKTYIQTIEGKEGKPTTRVRVGPFETRAQAEQVAVRIRKLDLQAHVIVL